MTLAEQEQRINAACQNRRWVTAMVGKRRVRIGGVKLRGKGKPFTRGSIWANLWGTDKWQLVPLDSVSIRDPWSDVQLK